MTQTQTTHAYTQWLGGDEMNEQPLEEIKNKTKLDQKITPESEMRSSGRARINSRSERANTGRRKGRRKGGRG
jgi:hypothetical protein